jgi:hypothetical protein
MIIRDRKLKSAIAQAIRERADELYNNYEWFREVDDGNDKQPIRSIETLMSLLEQGHEFPDTPMGGAARLERIEVLTEEIARLKSEIKQKDESASVDDTRS